MIGFGIFVSICFILMLGFYRFFFHLARKDIKEINMYFMIVFLLCFWSVWLMSDLQEKLSKIAYLAFGILGLYLFKIVKENAKKEDIEIKVKQMSYWNIKPSSIYKFYNFRTIPKAKRIETKINKLSKNFYRQYANDKKFLTGNIFKEIEDIELTKIKSIKDLSNSLLYEMIYKKVKEFVESLEKEVDWQEILKENDYYAEYFLIDIWCRYTKPFNIGTANLSILATNNTEYELVGAIDNADLNSVKRHGAALFFLYAKFKNIIPQDEAYQNNENADLESDEAKKYREENGEDPEF